jgi:DNA-binding transcriptional ArsR family regulator
MVMAVELDAAAFKALSSKTRVALLKKLKQKPRSLTSLAIESGLSVQAVDEHLRKLADAGLVEKRKHAKWSYYALSPSGLHLVQPNRQPVYVLLSISFFLLMASALTFVDQGITSKNNFLPMEKGPVLSAEMPGEPVLSASTVQEVDEAMDEGGSSGIEKDVKEKAVSTNKSTGEASELPWASIFGFAGIAVLLAAVVLWVKKTNRF